MYVNFIMVLKVFLMVKKVDGCKGHNLCRLYMEFKMLIWCQFSRNKIANVQIELEIVNGKRSIFCLQICS